MSNATTVSETLSRAADIIEKDWTKGAYSRPYGEVDEYGFVTGKVRDCYCAVGALRKAAVGTAVPVIEPDLVQAACHTLIEAQIVPLPEWATIQSYGDAVGHIINWNDAPERTRDQVVSSLRAAAERAATE